MFRPSCGHLQVYIKNIYRNIRVVAHLRGIPVVLHMYKMTLYKTISNIKPIEHKPMEEAQVLI